MKYKFNKMKNFFVLEDEKHKEEVIKHAPPEDEYKEDFEDGGNPEPE